MGVRISRYESIPFNPKRTAKMARQQYATTTPLVSEVSATAPTLVMTGRPTSALTSIPAPEPVLHSNLVIYLSENLIVKLIRLTKSDLNLMYAK
jgi:hypothetical protein